MHGIMGTRTPLLALTFGMLWGALADPTLAPGVWTNISPGTIAWQYLGTGNCFTQSLAIDPQNPSTIYLCVQDFDTPNVSGGLYRTTDGGSTWTRLGPMDQGENVRVDPQNSAHLYCADIQTGPGTHSGFWVSTDGGQTWAFPAGFTDVLQNSVHTSDVYHADVDPTDFSHVLVSFHSGWNGGTAGVIESFDGGNTFTVHQPDPGMPSDGGTDVLMLYNPALGIGDNKTWLFGIQGGGGYWRTTDAGATWKQVTTNSMDHGGAQLYYTKSGMLYCTGNPNLMRSSDNGVNWTTVGPSGAYLGIAGDGTNLWALTHGGGSFITSPETDGVNWTTYNTQSFPAGGTFNFAFDSTNSILYSATTGSGLLALRINKSNTGIVLSNEAANPASALDNATTAVTVSADATASGGISSVTIDLRPVGGDAAVVMTRGTGATYSAAFTLHPGATPGDKILLVKATNAAGQSLYGALAFTVVDHTAPVLVSRGKNVVASSTQSAALPPSAVVDGDLNTRWASGAGDPQWIYVDLGAPTSVCEVILNWEAAYASAYQIQVSNDTANWTTVFSTTTGDGHADTATFAPATGRYVRLYGTQRATAYGYSLYEFQIFSPPPVTRSAIGASAAKNRATTGATRLAFLRQLRTGLATGLYDVKGQRMPEGHFGEQAIVVRPAR